MWGAWEIIAVGLIAIYAISKLKKADMRKTAKELGGAIKGFKEGLKEIPEEFKKGSEEVQKEVKEIEQEIKK